MEASVSLTSFWILFCCVLVFTMQAGFACLESGLVRTKNTINVAAKNFADTIISILIFSVIGYHLMFSENLLSISAVQQLLFAPSTAEIQYHFLYQALFCGTAATIVSGAVAERMAYSGYLIVTAVMAAMVYPVIGRWIWNETGWLAELGAVDFAGSSVVHSTGGWASLAAILIVGPRLRRFKSEKFNNQCQNFPFAMLGVFLLWIGWLGFNGGSSLTFDGQTPLIILNTILGGVGGAVLPITLMIAMPDRVSVFSILHGPIAGLVAMTASANIIQPGEALLLGIAGGGILICAEKLLYQLRIDDGIGVIGPHLAAGIFGTMVVPFFATDVQLAAAGGFFALLGVQAMMVAAVGIWAFGVTFVSLKLVSHFYALRVTAREEVIGLNQSEHGIMTEFVAIQKQLRAQIRSVDLMGTMEAAPDSDISKLIAFHNRAIEAFHEKYDTWLGEISQKDAANNILRVRTSDLEDALVKSDADLRLSTKKIADVGHLVEKLVQTKVGDNKKSEDLVRSITTMCATHLRSILKETGDKESWGKPQDAARKLESITDKNNAILSRLMAVHMLIELDDIERTAASDPIDWGDMIITVVNKCRAKNRKIAIQCIIPESLSPFFGDTRLLEGAIVKLVERATKRAVQHVMVKCREHEGGSMIEISEDGENISENIINSIVKPLSMIINGSQDMTALDSDLCLAARIFEIHGAEVKVTNLHPQGTDIRIIVPSQTAKTAPRRKAS